MNSHYLLCFLKVKLLQNVDTGIHILMGSKSSDFELQKVRRQISHLLRLSLRMYTSVYILTGNAVSGPRRSNLILDGRNPV